MLPFGLSDFIRLLQLGFTGLAGALLLFSFFLLLSEQRRPQVRAKMLQAIQRWVVVCIVVLILAIGANILQLYVSQKAPPRRFNLARLWSDPNGYWTSLKTGSTEWVAFDPPFDQTPPTVEVTLLAGGVQPADVPVHAYEHPNSRSKWGCSVDFKWSDPNAPPKYAYAEVNASSP
jgi:hypothetical protein